MSVTAEQILSELQQLVTELKGIDDVNYIIDKYMCGDKEEMIKLYHAEVAHLPKNDPVHIAIVNILYFLGINPFDSVKMKDLLNDNIDDCDKTLNRLSFKYNRFIDENKHNN